MILSTWQAFEFRNHSYWRLTYCLPIFYIFCGQHSLGSRILISHTHGLENWDVMTKYVLSAFSLFVVKTCSSPLDITSETLSNILKRGRSRIGNSGTSLSSPPRVRMHVGVVKGLLE